MMQVKKTGRFILGILSLLLVATISFGATWALNAHRTEQENNLQSRTVSTEIEEEFPDKTVDPDTTKVKAVAVKNTGTAAAFVRVSYTESWTTATALLEGDTAVQKNWTADWSADWMDGGDGWFYYKKVLPAGGSVNILTGVTFPATVPTDADYNLNFQTECVQVSDEAAVNTDATQNVFGKTGTVSGATIANGAVTSGSVSWS